MAFLAREVSFPPSGLFLLREDVDKEIVATMKAGLPSDPGKLQQFIQIGEEYMKAQKAYLRILSKLDEAADYYKAKKQEAQKVDVTILEARIKLGEFLSKIEPKYQKRELLTGNSHKDRAPVQKPSLPKGISKKDSHMNQTLYKANKDEPNVIASVVERQHKIGDFVTVNHVYRKIKEKEKAAPIVIEGKYSIIYADPPWKYGNTMSNNFTEQGGEYPLMSIDEICAIDIKSHVNENAVLFLWVTWPILEQSFQVIKAWGFKYKAGWCWDKIDHVMGHYNSVRSELLLLGIRGSYPLQEKKLFDNVYSEKRTAHSAKPKHFRTVIDTIYPEGAAAELFFRGDTSTLLPRWDVYGNEVSKE